MLSEIKLAEQVFAVFPRGKLRKPRMRSDLPPESGSEFQGPGPDPLESPVPSRFRFRTDPGPGEVAVEICEGGKLTLRNTCDATSTPRTDAARSTPAGRGERVQAPAPVVAGRPDASTPSRPPGERRPPAVPPYQRRVAPFDAG